MIQAGLPFSRHARFAKLSTLNFEKNCLENEYRYLRLLSLPSTLVVQPHLCDSPRACRWFIWKSRARKFTTGPRIPAPLHLAR
jgi:hypothetical protein